MQITRAPSAPPRPRSPRGDTAFLRLLVGVNGGVPLLILGWDTYRHELGVNGVNFALHTTGLLGLLFLLFSLAITPIRRLTGWNPIIALRRTLGLYGFFYLCVHFAIFFLFDRAGSIGSTVHEILTRRYLQIGTAGLALLVPLALTSTDAMVTRLGARRWKALHRLTYLATSLGALHYILLVKADLRQPLVFAAVLAVLLGFRVVRFSLDARQARARHRAAAATTTSARRPRFWSGELRVLRIVQETPDVRTFRLVAMDGGPLPFLHQPGQYLNIALTIDGERVNRSYTIASSPKESSHCEVTVKRTMAGRASRYLHDVVREGATVKVSAPAGRFVFTGVESQSVLLIAGGVGITPLMAIVRYLTDSSWGGSAVLIFAARKSRDVIFSGELGRLAARFPRLRVFVTLSGEEDPSWAGHRGRISADLLKTAAPDAARRPVYLCGPEAMMADTRTLLLGLGVPDAQIRTEAFVSAATTASMPVPGEPPVETARAGPGADGEALVVANEAIPAVTFRRSQKTADLPADRTILEVAEDAGIDIPFECRSGICGQCKTRLLTGRVTMEVQDALSAADRSRGLILACQARSTWDVAVDA